MNIIVLGTDYCDFGLCTVTDGLLALGHKVYDLTGKGLNYMTPYPWEGNRPKIDIFFAADTDNKAAVSELWWDDVAGRVPKVILHLHDRWTDYLRAPNSPLKPIKYDEWRCDIAFIRDWDGNGPTGASQKSRGHPDYPIYPMEFGVERRYIEASLAELADKKAFTYVPWFDRKFDVAFFGTKSTANRDKVLQLFQEKMFRCNFGDAHSFTQPDSYWSKWVNGRYTHAPLYYKALANSIFALSPLGAGPSCGRTYEGYAAGCIPLIQRYPKEIIQIIPFVDGQNCILWDTPEELIERVSDYINYHPDELNELQSRCVRFAAEHLQSKHRAQFILDKMTEQGLLQ